MMTLRSAGAIRGHGPSSNALRAAATARSTSSLPHSAMRARVMPFAGLIVLNVFPLFAVTQRPAMIALVVRFGMVARVLVSSIDLITLRLGLAARLNEPIAFLLPVTPNHPFSSTAIYREFCKRHADIMSRGARNGR